ncbi:glycosyltransferase [Acinetobacter cumulans]|uniref:Glycosyltransferase n=1 Tax=Acinetobacter cumulans TaxID=2136182 RepID=A0A498D0U3_9GAMM|nr:glycosyltransferase family 4 protein [Acinetobacter cumulans]RLL38310.1 glycosyltransferase [Acinetobacter cumulans]
MTNRHKTPAIWFPTVQTGTGTDVFTQRLVDGLNQRGIRAEITWLPLRAEYLPWSVSIPQPPEWATIVHVNTWLHHRFLPQNLPIVATIHHSIHDPKLKLYKGLLRSLYHQYWIAPNERRVMKQAAKVTAVSQFVANLAKKTLCNIPINVIYNGVNTNLFHKNSKTQNMKEPCRLLYVGAWRTLKGVDLLPIIMQKLGNNFELYYTGGKAAEKDKISMPPNMYDLGKLNQQKVIHEMQQADVFLFLSRSEGFGLAVVEAMACGLPVIALEGTAVDEIIDHKINGYLAKDDEDAVSIIKRIYNQYTLLNQLSNAANVKARNDFSEITMLNSYISLYENM